MTRTSYRPIAFIAAAALVSTMWFQTLTIPASADARTVTIAAVA